MSRTAKPKNPLTLIPERDVIRNGTKLLKALGWTVYRRNVGMMIIRDPFGKPRAFRSGEAGQADTYGSLPYGDTIRYFELEFKRYGKQPTAIQRDWLLKCNGEPNKVAFWVDDVEILRKCALFLMAGGRVVYTGRWADYDIIMP